jgi:hypothetical protein
MPYCDMTADCPADTHSKGCWRGWAQSQPARRPAEPGYFEIEAEYLHLYVGRRAAMRSERGTKIPFVIDAVALRPETGLIEVDAFLPHQVIGFVFGAGDVVEVQHAA